MGDLVRQLPGMRLDRGGIINESLRQNVSGSTGVISTFLDGVLTPTDLVLSTPQGAIDGLEAYDVAGKLPVAFAGPETGCGAVLIWTSQTR
jgi:uncharacterized Zn-binding protein involved in type VI secretion